MEEVQALTAKNKITLKDLTMLRSIFGQIMSNNSNNESAGVQEVKITQFFLEVKTHKQESLTRAYKQMI